MSNKMKYLMALIALMLCINAGAQTTPTTVNVGVMLPLHNVDGDGRRMIEYYRGILLAVEKLKQEGNNINVHAWNVPIDADVRATLLQDGAPECNIIFGPLYSKQVKAMGDFCKAYNIKMVIPFSINGNDVDHNDAIYQVYQSPDELNAKAIKHAVENFADYHVVIIDCNDSTSRKGAFTTALRNMLRDKGREASITNLKSSNDIFARAFSISQPNLVILNTGRSPELTQAFSKLEAVQRSNEGVRISMYGYTEWLMYAKFNKEKFAKFDTYIPTTYYHNETSIATRTIESNYKKSFGEEMMSYDNHFALTGYDHAMYFIGNRRSWVQTPLKFQKQSDGGYRNKSFMLIHYKTKGGVEALHY